MIYIITFSGSVNYGAALQGYALYKAVIKMGYSCKVIDYNRKIHHFNYILPGFKEQSFKGKCWNILTIGSKYKTHCKFNRFVKKVENLTKAYNGSKTLFKAEWKSTDTYIVGSDQVFNLDMTEGNFHYFLDFVNSPNKIAYAPSFGTEAVAEQYKEQCREYLQKFRKLTVREESGAEIIYELSGIYPEVVLDPCFLLDSKEWERIFVKPNTEKYVLLFVFSPDSQIIEKAKAYAEKKHLKLINIAYGVNQVEEAQNLRNLSPEEWGGYFRYAEKVYTDSFHGMVFSLIFRRKFAVGLDKRKGKATRNSRIVDLLTRLGAEYILDNQEEEINYNILEEKLVREIEKSQNILKNLLQVSEEK